MDYKFCPKCGNKLPKDALFCNSCGEKMPTVQQERSNVVNSSQPESITTQVPSTPKVEEQRVSNGNSVESSEETQKSGTMRFFFSIIFYCALLYFFSGVSLFGVISMAAIAYLSYRFFIKKLFVAKSWSLKFVPELCFIIGFVAVSALFGSGNSSSGSRGSSSSIPTEKVSNNKTCSECGETMTNVSGNLCEGCKPRTCDKCGKTFKERTEPSPCASNLCHPCYERKSALRLFKNVTGRDAIY